MDELKAMLEKKRKESQASGGNPAGKYRRRGENESAAREIVQNETNAVNAAAKEAKDDVTTSYLNPS